jgi:purine-nucleoside phosphorylase
VPVSSVEGPFELASTAAAALRDRLGPHRSVVILGSGWAAAADRLGPVVAHMPAHELPGVPAPTVTGHEGAVRSIDVAGASPVLVVAGRSHLYEGHPPDAVVHLVRAAVLAGCDTVVLTNAAGSLRRELAVGTPVLVSDHLNLTGTNPMTGPPPPDGMPGRFVDLSDLYDAALRAALRARRPELAEGVYAGLLGGSFETPAEIRMLSTMGADLVGMSTVLEAIAARHLGARVLGLSLVTNLAAGLTDHVDHQEVLDAGDAAAATLHELLRDVVAVT